MIEEKYNDKIIRRQMNIRNKPALQPELAHMQPGCGGMRVMMPLYLESNIYTAACIFARRREL